MEELMKEAFGRFYLDSFMLKKSQVYIYTIGCFYPEMFEEKLHKMMADGIDYLRNIEMIISPPYGKGPGAICSKCRGWGQKRSSNARVSCGFRRGSIRSTTVPSIRKPIR